MLKKWNSPVGKLPYCVLIAANMKLRDFKRQVKALMNASVSAENTIIICYGVASEGQMNSESIQKPHKSNSLSGQWAQHGDES